MFSETTRRLLERTDVGHVRTVAAIQIALEVKRKAEHAVSTATDCATTSRDLRSRLRTPVSN